MQVYNCAQSVTAAKRFLTKFQVSVKDFLLMQVL